MNPKMLDQLDGMDGDTDGVGGIFDSLGAALKSVAAKALPIVSSIFTQGGAGAIVGATAAYVSAQSQKKLIDAQSKLAQAQSDSQRIAAEARLQKAQIDVAASQTVVNGMNNGIIPSDASYPEAAQLVVHEVVRSAGVSPTSPQGAQAAHIITQAAVAPSPMSNTLLYVGGAVAAVALIAVVSRGGK